MTEENTQLHATTHLLRAADGRICSLSVTENRPDMVFGMPEVFRIKPDGSIELAEGKELNDAARAFLHAVAQMRSTNGTPATLSARQETRPEQVGEVQGDALMALVANWRAQAATHEVNGLEADSIGLTAAAMRHDARHHLLEQAANELEAALAARQPMGATVKNSFTVGGGQAWVVADGQGARWRMWGSYGPEWTSDRDQALHFARRADAEAFANDDEDAWLIQPVGIPAQAVDLGQEQDAIAGAG